MMKKMLALALLTVVSLQAGKCCDELKGIVGTVQLDRTNIVPTSTLPVCLSQSGSGNCGPLLLTPLNGCYTIANGCLTLRDDSEATRFVSVNQSDCVTLSQCPAFVNFAEAILELDVVFDKPFKNRPVVTATLEVNTPFGSKDDFGNFTCPLACGGTVICSTDGLQLGYFNDVLVFVSNVNNNGFKLWLDVKFVLQGGVPPAAILQGFISQAGALLHFHAIAAQNV